MVVQLATSTSAASRAPLSPVKGSLQHVAADSSWRKTMLVYDRLKAVGALLQGSRADLSLIVSRRLFRNPTDTMIIKEAATSIHRGYLTQGKPVPATVDVDAFLAVVQRKISAYAERRGAAAVERLFVPAVDLESSDGGNFDDSIGDIKDGRRSAVIEQRCGGDVPGEVEGLAEAGLGLAPDLPLFYGEPPGVGSRSTGSIQHLYSLHSSGALKSASSATSIEDANKARYLSAFRDALLSREGDVVLVGNEHAPEMEKRDGHEATSRAGVFSHSQSTPGQAAVKHFVETRSAGTSSKLSSTHPASASTSSKENQQHAENNSIDHDEGRSRPRSARRAASSIYTKQRISAASKPHQAGTTESSSQLAGASKSSSSSSQVQPKRGSSNAAATAWKEIVSQRSKRTSSLTTASSLRNEEKGSEQGTQFRSALRTSTSSAPSGKERKTPLKTMKANATAKSSSTSISKGNSLASEQHQRLEVVDAQRGVVEIRGNVDGNFADSFFSEYAQQRETDRKQRQVEHTARSSRFDRLHTGEQRRTRSSGITQQQLSEQGPKPRNSVDRSPVKKIMVTRKGRPDLYYGIFSSPVKGDDAHNGAGGGGQRCINSPSPLGSRSDAQPETRLRNSSMEDLVEEFRAFLELRTSTEAVPSGWQTVFKPAPRNGEQREEQQDQGRDTSRGQHHVESLRAGDEESPTSRGYEYLAGNIRLSRGGLRQQTSHDDDKTQNPADEAFWNHATCEDEQQVTKQGRFASSSSNTAGGAAAPYTPRMSPDHEVHVEETLAQAERVLEDRETEEPWPTASYTIEDTAMPRGASQEDGTPIDTPIDSLKQRLPPYAFGFHERVADCEEEPQDIEMKGNGSEEMSRESGAVQEISDGAPDPTTTTTTEKGTIRRPRPRSPPPPDVSSQFLEATGTATSSMGPLVKRKPARMALLTREVAKPVEVLPCEKSNRAEKDHVEERPIDPVVKNVNEVPGSVPPQEHEPNSDEDFILQDAVHNPAFERIRDGKFKFFGYNDQYADMIAEHLLFPAPAKGHGSFIGNGNRIVAEQAHEETNRKEHKNYNIMASPSDGSTGVPTRMPSGIPSGILVGTPVEPRSSRHGGSTTISTSAVPTSSSSRGHVSVGNGNTELDDVEVRTEDTNRKLVSNISKQTVVSPHYVVEMIDDNGNDCASEEHHGLGHALARAEDLTGSNRTASSRAPQLNNTNTSLKPNYTSNYISNNRATSKFAGFIGTSKATMSSKGSVVTIRRDPWASSTDVRREDSGRSMLDQHKKDSSPLNNEDTSGLALQYSTELNFRKTLRDDGHHGKHGGGHGGSALISPTYGCDGKMVGAGQPAATATDYNAILSRSHDTCTSPPIFGSPRPSRQSRRRSGSNSLRYSKRRDWPHQLRSDDQAYREPFRTELLPQSKFVPIGGSTKDSVLSSTHGSLCKSSSRY
ncbi:unnamed protein product [Amoebophrya sp. A25]|nr:unnamed protein product [Amoebophrya sp. A25]|eukprot:GSA25T00013192001.1